MKRFGLWRSGGRYGDGVVLGLAIVHCSPTKIGKLNRIRGLQAEATDISTRRYHSSIRTTYGISSKYLDAMTLQGTCNPFTLFCPQISMPINSPYQRFPTTCGSTDQIPIGMSLKTPPCPSGEKYGIQNTSLCSQQPGDPQFNTP